MFKTLGDRDRVPRALLLAYRFIGINGKSDFIIYEWSIHLGYATVVRFPRVCAADYCLQMVLT